MKKPGFLGRQLAAYSLLIAMAVSILIFWAYWIVLDISREKAMITQEQLTASALEQVDSYLDRIMLIATQVAHDSEIVSIMQSLSTEENDPDSNYFSTNLNAQVKMNQLLEKHNEIKDPVQRIAVFTATGDFTCTSPSADFLQNRVECIAQPWFQDFLPRAFITEQRDFIMMGPAYTWQKEIMGEPYIYMLMPIRNQDKTETYGYVQVYESLTPLFAQLDHMQQNNTDVYLFCEFNLGDRGTQIYPLNRPYPDPLTDNYYETSRQSYYRWFVVLLQDQKEFLTPYRSMLLYLLLGGLALLLLLFACVYLIARYTSRPILQLSRQVRETTLTNLPELSVTGNAMDEVKELEYSFDRMMQRLKTSLQLEQQAYFRALQAQMKPHFLYNCLANVSSMALELDNDTIPRFCSHLTSMLRYESTYDSSLVTLADELGNLKDYLALMKTRYEDDLTCTLEVEQSLLSLPLPRLVLQPLVENCFDHGLRTVAPPWQISLRVFREDSCWCIAITDNGIGFDPDKLLQLQQQIDRMSANLKEAYTELKIGSLGLANTIVRIRLAMDSEISFHVVPNEPRGTTILLKGSIPDERFDC